MVRVGDEGSVRIKLGYVDLDCLLEIDPKITADPWLKISCPPITIVEILYQQQGRGDNKIDGDYQPVDDQPVDLSEKCHMMVG